MQKLRKVERYGVWGYTHHIHVPVLLLGFAFLTSFLLSACSLESLSTSTWQASTLTHQHIHALAVNPKNSQVIYAGDVQGNIFSSNDAGLHWTPRSPISSSSVTLLALTIDPSGTKMYAATTTGLIVSTDNAQSWHPVSTSILPTDTYTAPIFTSAQQVYIGTMHHGIYTSSDDAATWHAKSGGLPTNIAINNIAFDSLQHRLWLATSAGVYRSDDGGASWHALNTGFPTGTIATSVQPAASAGGDTSLVYAGTTKGFYLSTDSGTHWTGIAVLQYVYIRQVFIDFRSKNAATIYVATNVGLFRSNDSGQDWAGVGSGIPRNQAVYTLVIGTKQASQLYAASNNVYLYPGTSGTGIDLSRVFSLIVVLLLFVVLFYVVRREVRRYRRKPQQSDEAEEQESTTAKRP